MKKNYIAITLGLMCFLLTFGIVLQLNTINSANSIATQTRKENGLRDEVLKWKDKYDNTYYNIEKAEKELEEIRLKVTQNDSNATQIEEELNTSNILLGMTEVKGQGITIELEDGIDLIHDNDIISIVNELKNAGAEAISINDQRIVSTTSITCDGNVIMINGQKVGTPFFIKAIGNSASLYGALSRKEGIMYWLDYYGVYTKIEQSEDITISKYNGVINSKYLKSVE